MSRDPMTYQILHSLSEPILDEQPTVGMSDEEELRRYSLEGLGEEVLVDLRELGIIADD